MSNRIGQAILDARKTEGISQHDVAELVGVWQPSVSHWELGRFLPSEECWGKLCDVFPALASVPFTANRAEKGTGNPAGNPGPRKPTSTPRSSASNEP